jgi:hypothetical protein
MYVQRTADDRLAIGGRWILYRFGSGFDANGQTNARCTRHTAEPTGWNLPGRLKPSRLVKVTDKITGRP